MGTEDRLRAAESWFGYGRWDAPYWFIGMEQGGSDDGPEKDSYAAWARLGGGELLDCAKHHREFNFNRWHGDGNIKPELQQTWRPLIKLLLGYLGLPADREDARVYQREHWGAADGETAVLEISCMRAKVLGTHADRMLFRPQRISTLRSRLNKNRPVFAVCYGLGYQETYEEIIGTRFDAAGWGCRGNTLFVLMQGPTAPNPGGDASWIGKGQEIAKKVRALKIS